MKIVNSICNYIPMNGQALQLDSCSKSGFPKFGGSSRGFYCNEEDSGIYIAQLKWWSNSTTCGKDEGDKTAIYTDLINVYNCTGGDDICYCNGNDDECDIAIKTTYGGKPGQCNYTSYDEEKIVLGVCIPDDSSSSSSSSSTDSSKVIECAKDGTSLRNKVFETSDCTGDYQYNYDLIDEDTCYQIDCQSKGGDKFLQIHFITSYIIIISILVQYIS